MKRQKNDVAEAEARRVTKVQPPIPATLPRQQAQLAGRWSATETTTAAEVSRQRRMLAARFVAANVGCETVPTEAMGRPSVVIVEMTDGDQFPRSAGADPDRAFRQAGRPKPL